MKLDDFKIFKRADNKTSLQETSKDTSKGKTAYMSNSNRKVINFDAVKTEYLNSHYMSEEHAKSVDALFQIPKPEEKDDGIYMVEFKNGDFFNSEIATKVHDSLLIFQSITNTQIEYARENLRFILVYNEEAKRVNSRNKKALVLAEKGRTDYTLFGLEKLRGFCFKEVHAYNRDMFRDKVESHFID